MLHIFPCVVKWHINITIQDEEEGDQNESPDTTATADTEEVVEADTEDNIEADTEDVEADAEEDVEADTEKVVETINE